MLFPHRNLEAATHPYHAGGDLRDCVDLGTRAWTLEDVTHAARVRDHSDVHTSRVLVLRACYRNGGKSKTFVRFLIDGHADHASPLLLCGKNVFVPFEYLTKHVCSSVLEYFDFSDTSEMGSSLHGSWIMDYTPLSKRLVSPENARKLTWLSETRAIHVHASCRPIFWSSRSQKVGTFDALFLPSSAPIFFYHAVRCGLLWTTCWTCS